MIIIVLSAVCASCEKKNQWKSLNLVIYKQFSKDVYFALKGAAFFTQLVTQACSTKQLILTCRGDWWAALRGLNEYPQKLHIISTVISTKIDWFWWSLHHITNNETSNIIGLPDWTEGRSGDLLCFFFLRFK